MVARIIAILLAFLSLTGVVTLAFVAVHGNAHKQEVAAPAKPEVRVKILVAARDIPGGILLRPDDLRSKSVLQNDVPVDSIPDSGDERKALNGALLRVSVSSGGVISPGAVVKPGDHSYLSAVLRPGETAVSISVDAVTGLSGMIWPGDIVNLIVTHDLDNGDKKPLAAETVLGGVRVVAVDQDLEHGKSPGGNIRETRTITLAVSPKDAETVNLAGQMGKLSVALRSIADGDAPSVPHATLASEISPAMQQVRQHVSTDEKPSIHVFNGATEAQ